MRMSSNHGQDAGAKRRGYQRAHFAGATKERAQVYRETRFSRQRGSLRIDRKEKTIVKKIFQKIGLQQCILDVPCGAGRYLDLLRAHATRLIEVDLSFGMVQYNEEQFTPHASAQTGRVAFLLGDAEWLPFRSHSIDLVFC